MKWRTARRVVAVIGCLAVLAVIFGIATQCLVATIFAAVSLVLALAVPAGIALEKGALKFFGAIFGNSPQTAVFIYNQER